MTTEQKIEQMHKAKVQRWDNSSLGAQIGGLLHDSVQIVLFKSKKTDSYDKILKDITDILTQLRAISDFEKEPKPIDLEKAEQQGNDWKKKMAEDERLETGAKESEINSQLAMAAEPTLPIIQEN